MGRGDNVRAAKVATQNNELTRVINHLYPLEVTEVNESESVRNKLSSTQDDQPKKVIRTQRTGIKHTSSFLSIIMILIYLFGCASPQLRPYDSSNPDITERFSLANIEDTHSLALN